MSRHTTGVKQALLIKNIVSCKLVIIMIMFHILCKYRYLGDYRNDIDSFITIICEGYENQCSICLNRTFLFIYK